MRGSNIRLVYMDLDMPRSRKGIEIAEAIGKRWPPIEIVLTAAHFTRGGVNFPQRAEFYPKTNSHEEAMGAMFGFSNVLSRHNLNIQYVFDLLCRQMVIAPDNVE